MEEFRHDITIFHGLPSIEDGQIDVVNWSLGDLLCCLVDDHLFS